MALGTLKEVFGFNCMTFPFNSISDIRRLEPSQAERVRYLGQLKDDLNTRADTAPPNCRTGKICGKRCIPKDHTCGGAEDRAITMAYHHIGGDDIADDLTQKNKKMTKEHAQMYTREIARSHLIAQRDPQAGNRELDRVNKKYASSFGG